VRERVTSRSARYHALGSASSDSLTHTRAPAHMPRPLTVLSRSISGPTSSRMGPSSLRTWAVEGRRSSRMGTRAT
jgi:hypothetical protein